MQAQEARPPYARFEVIAVPDRTKEIEKGVYAFKDVEVVHLTAPGQRDTTTRYVNDWLEDVQKRAADGFIPAHWYQGFRAQYDAWKKQVEPPVDGTPIKGWSSLTPAQQATVLQAGIRTVEDLAAANDVACAAIGMGGVTLKQKAQAWLDAAKDVGKVVEQNNALQVLNAELQRRNEELATELRRLTGEQGAAKAPAPF